MTSPNTRVLTAHVPAPLAAKVDASAERMNRSSRWVEQEEKRHHQTLEALADVDAGQLLGHDDVEAWAHSVSTNHPLPLPPCQPS